MASNGWLYTKGHRTAASPAWVDAVLAGSDDVRDLDSFVAAGETIAVYATAADVVLVNVPRGLQVAYASRTGGFTCVRRVGDALYCGAENGIYRLDLTGLDWQAAHGDLTPAYWAPLYHAASTPALLADEVRDLVGWQYDGRDYLAVLCRNEAHGAWRNSVTLVNITAGVSFHEKRKTSNHDALENLGNTLYASAGRFVNVLYDAAAVASDEWTFAVTVAGRVAYPFPGGLVGFSLQLDSAAAVSSVVEMPVGALPSAVRTVTQASVYGVNNFTYAHPLGFLAGDFDISFRLGVPPHDQHPWPVHGANDECGVGVYCRFPGWPEEHPACDWDGVFAERVNGANPGFYDALRVKDDYTGVWTYLDYAVKDFWLRFVRSGATVSVYYGDGADGVPATLAATYADQPTTPAFFSIVNLSGNTSMPFTADLTDMVDTYAGGGAYGGLPGEAITGFAVAAATAENGDTLFIAAGGNLYVCAADQSAPCFSESGGTILARALDDFTPVAVACDPDAAAETGLVYLGSAAAGVRAYRGGESGVAFAFTETGGQPLVDDAVRVLRAGGSFLYGAAAGAGWISPDATGPGRTGLRATEQLNNVFVGWTAPADVDYDHSYLQRRRNGGAWATLQADGWGGSGALVRFTAAANPPGYYDAALDYGKYEYRLFHVDQAGNETECEPPLRASFIDCPRPLALTAPSVADSTGIVVTVAADSGANSGHEMDQVEYVAFRVGAADYGEWRRYESTREYELKLPAAADTYEIRARFASRGLLAGADYAVDTVTLDPAAGFPPTVPDSVESVVVAGPFYSDNSAVSFTARLVPRSGGEGENVACSAFPLANLRDPRLGVKAVLDASGLDDTHDLQLTVDLGADQDLRFVMLAGHNLADFAGCADLYLRTYQTLGGAACSNTKIDNLADDDPLLLDLTQDPPHRARYVRLVVRYGEGFHPAALSLGRLVVAIDSAAYLWQPQTNIEWGFRFGREDVTQALNETPGGRYAVNPDQRLKAEIDAEAMPETDFAGLAWKYEQNLRHAPVLLLLDPARLPDHRTDGAAASGSYAGPRRLALYGCFDNGEILSTVGVGYLNSFTGLRFVEARAGD